MSRQAVKPVTPFAALQGLLKKKVFSPGRFLPLPSFICERGREEKLFCTQQTKIKGEKLYDAIDKGVDQPISPAL